MLKATAAALGLQVFRFLRHIEKLGANYSVNSLLFSLCGHVNLPYNAPSLRRGCLLYVFIFYSFKIFFPKASIDI